MCVVGSKSISLVPGSSSLSESDSDSTSLSSRARFAGEVERTTSSVVVGGGREVRVEGCCRERRALEEARGVSAPAGVAG